MEEVEILILSNKIDLTTDYVSYELERRNTRYLRLNRDCFSDYKIIFDMSNLSLSIEIDGNTFLICEKSLKAIYFRAPVFTREFSSKEISIEEQLYKSQWNSFIRNLIVYENIVWINNPVATYKAENKMLQLSYAKKLGFTVPLTYITNTNQISLLTNTEYAVKSLDTAHFKNKTSEFFVYTNIINGGKIKNSNLNISPVIIQEYLEPKIDLRVSVIGKKVYAVSIMKDNNGVQGDWRKEKNSAIFTPFNLPEIIQQKCLELTNKLGLVFGAIDLAICDNKYYFIEINPTGEWAWLVDTCSQNTYLDICDVLLCEQ